MALATTPATTKIVAYVEAGAARLASDFLSESARDWRRDAPEGDASAAAHADRLDVAAEALHRAGWAQDGYEQAREAGQRDEFLDAPGPSIHLPGVVADALLEARGWTIERLTQRTLRKSNTGGTLGGIVEEVAYVLPGGKLRAQGGQFGTDYLWERDDALRLALTAEAFALGVEA